MLQDCISVKGNFALECIGDMPVKERNGKSQAEKSRDERNGRVRGESRSDDHRRHDHRDSSRSSRRDRDRDRGRERSRHPRHRSRSRSPRRDRSSDGRKHRRSSRSRSSEYRHSRYSSGRSSRDYSRERTAHDAGRDHHSHRHREGRPRSKSRERERSHRRPSKDVVKPSRPASPEPPRRDPSPELPQAERDKRTIFVAQLHAQARARDIRDFFEKNDVGRVRDVRLIADRGSRRMKGLGYIEFCDLESVDKAVQLNGKQLMGIPIIVQKTEAEKNRAAEAAAAASLPPRPGSHGIDKKDSPQSHTLFVSNLPNTLGAADVRQIFEPFGQIDNVQLVKESHSRKCGAYVTFQRSQDASQAVQAMLGFSIGDNVIRCTLASDSKGAASTELDDVESAGLKLNPMSRAELMAKLARSDVPVGGMATASNPSSAVATRCLLLTNMFNPAEETEPNWDREIAQDVQDECERSYGPVRHINVIKDSMGQVYLKFSTLGAAEKALNSLNGRWFASRQVSATYISDATYNARFPEATLL